MFFTQFPKTDYSIQNDAVQTKVTDYFRYVDVIDKLAKNVFAYSTVDILNGERPDNLSQRLYGTPDYYWTFFICNDELKQGLSAWPKSQSELTAHIKEQHKNLSAFRFPLSDGDSGKITPLGLPINDNDFLPYLHLCFIIDTFVADGVTVKIFAKAKIRSWEPNLSQIWIDTSTLTWFSDTKVYNDQVGDGGTLDVKYSALSKTAMFHSNDTAEFSVQFFDDGTAAFKHNQWLNSVLEIAQELRPNQDFQQKTFDTLDREYTILNTQYWQDGKLAPAYYGSENNVETEYAQGFGSSSNYVSREEEITEENEEHRTIKYVAPAYVQAFAKEYKRLINE